MKIELAFSIFFTPLGKISPVGYYIQQTIQNQVPLQRVQCAVNKNIELTNGDALISIMKYKH
ncbi:hypothetical protein TU52_12905 [Bacillus cereus]|uniref:Uncharacterized protein n=1 Tax=Bacillus albus TaxID=2026189 RepID=A0A1J9TIB0_9BACI|nr:hypothetical protein TU52_12905 [Bacillus cereus]OJD65848.1 hypothetical protein BAU25_09575 [Bacillus albus]